MYAVGKKLVFFNAAATGEGEHRDRVVHCNFAEFDCVSTQTGEVEGYRDAKGNDEQHDDCHVLVAARFRLVGFSIDIAFEFHAVRGDFENPGNDD